MFFSMCERFGDPGYEVAADENGIVFINEETGETVKNELPETLHNTPEHEKNGGHKNGTSPDRCRRSDRRNHGY